MACAQVVEISKGSIPSSLPSGRSFSILPLDSWPQAPGGVEEKHPMIKCRIPQIEPILTTPQGGGILIRYDFASKYLDKAQSSASNESPGNSNAADPQLTLRATQSHVVISQHNL